MDPVLIALLLSLLSLALLVLLFVVGITYSCANDELQAKNGKLKKGLKAERKQAGKARRKLDRWKARAKWTR